jgi:hypothetical protein
VTAAQGYRSAGCADWNFVSRPTRAIACVGLLDAPSNTPLISACPPLAAR